MKFTGFAMAIVFVAGTVAPQLLAQSVDNVGPPPPDFVARQLVRMLESGNAQVRMEAIKQLRGNASPFTNNHYRQAIPTLIKASASGDQELAVAATEVLTSFGSCPWAVFEFLTKNDTPLARSTFGRTLPAEVRVSIAHLDRRWPGALVASRLLPCLHGSKTEVRHCAMSCLAMLGDDGNPAVPVLVRVLRRGPEADRWRAAWALGMIGNRSKSVVEALAKARTPTRPWAGRALARLKTAHAPRVAFQKTLATLKQLLPAKRSRALQSATAREPKLPSLIALHLGAGTWPQRETAAMALKALHRR